MARVVLFQKPYGVVHGSRHFYRAMINGEYIDGEYKDVHKRYEDAKKAHAKLKAQNKKHFKCDCNKPGFKPVL